MSELFPFITIPEDFKPPSNKKLEKFKEVAWDFEKDEPIIENNKFKIIEGKEALKVWIYKCIKTNRYEHEVYSWDYGTELSDLIGQRYTKGLTESEATRYIKEALEVNPYILNVETVDSKLEGDVLSANVKVTTIYGEVEVNV
ncbi:DUF2634 domain-containing protein [Clostridioides mangenotii]|uniref:DUF2634 domain-containing protein n=1 Tax=Metaclostridioides mangenotii TaxID=1540 RepID=UPI001C0F6F5E|nr:DUF2634 domain-containing protein [Clostridioides mangenotii]MBU5306472.1 DUF2634 domain-containing protein [Clostridioides mangenotii]